MITLFQNQGLMARIANMLTNELLTKLDRENDNEKIFSFSSRIITGSLSWM
jgi:hypothetical protein